jgi:uncharacterized protein (DUF2336 family)
MTTAVSLIDDLERALAGGTESHRAEMLSRITDLFFSRNSRYSAAQMELFNEVIGKLAAAIEPVARAKLAARLAPERNAPAKVLRMLAFDDDIEVARPVLSASECLNEADLIDNANSKSQEHLVAISGRKALSEAVTDVLVTRGDQEVAYSVSKNPGARISYLGFRTLLRRSVGDDRLAMLVGTRGDLPRQHFQRLVDQASAAVRTRLMAENLGDSSTVERVVEEISTDLQTEAELSPGPDHSAARAAVEAMYRAGKLGEAEVRQFAAERRLPETAIALTLLCGVDSDVAERALLASSSDILVILAKLAGFSWETAKAILKLNAGDDEASEPNLEQAKASFERLRSGTARHVLGFYYSRLTGAEAG